ncbi:glycine zipper 2TM domain-containing protein [Luteimonas sp. MC1828]|uniref:glycine zipper 2TM domain-containing protein n=1 Tax=Luteimonas sp. MC1828 TaxID=2799787 RepID=UPI0018F1ED34|nr:glycine zipper 2TM domain-containing protein [Luteimonas sp. MC1828]MBJ7574852.1 glycine zipper 2TM domain-containing protein [Luteimonas sp. MC1828]
MRRSAATVLAVALAVASGAASAQSLGYNPGYPQADRYGQEQDAYYDEARVLRVDPVFDNARGYPTSEQQRCYSRDDYYAGDYAGDGYGYGDRYGNDPYARDGYDGRNNGGYQGGSENGRMVATVVGGLVGAVLGSKVGGGSGRYATSAIGTMVGGMAGREIYEATQRNRGARHGRVTVCDPVPDRSYQVSDNNYGGVNAYDVTYEYGGRQYTTRTAYHPGDTIRVRVDVRPE